MHQNNSIAQQFEANRPHLHAVAYRMLASTSEAEDAVQETWLRLHRSDTSGIENLRAWLTTVVARIALDMLRSRNARREEPLEANAPEQSASRESGSDPEHEFLLADSVGLALLVVLDRLSPAERLAFVLHDMFGLPFNEIAPIVDCSPTAARQLASRARRRVHGAATPDADFVRQREVAQAFLAASRNGDFEALLAVLDPDVVHRVDAFAAPPHGREFRGATTIAKAATSFSQRGQFSRLALLDGKIGIVFAPRGQLQIALDLTITHDKVTAIEVIGDPARLQQLEIRVLDDGRAKVL